MPDPYKKLKAPGAPLAHLESPIPHFSWNILLFARALQLLPALTHTLPEAMAGNIDGSVSRDDEGLYRGKVH